MCLPTRLMCLSSVCVPNFVPRTLRDRMFAYAGAWHHVACLSSPDSLSMCVAKSREQRMQLRFPSKFFDSSQKESEYKWKETGVRGDVRRA